MTDASLLHLLSAILTVNLKSCVAAAGETDCSTGGHSSISRQVVKLAHSSGKHTANAVTPLYRQINQHPDFLITLCEVVAKICNPSAIGVAITWLPGWPLEI
jgi:hypothetical protein